MGTHDLTVARGSALYIGALLGPGLLLLPGLAAAKAGPASILAWAGLLVVSGLLAVVFAALGRTRPSASGVQAYAEAGLGRAGGRAVAWCFLAGIVTGAPVVCAIGGNYVAALTGGGRASAAIAGGVLLLAVLGVTAGGARSSARVQMVLVVLLLAVVAAAAGGAAGHARAANWVPFAPHGWAATGSAASVLMLSFVGWEAVAPLTARFRDPRRQLPRVIGVAFAATSVIYLSLAAVTIAVLGAGAGTPVPLASLLEVAVGPAGRMIAAVAAVLLTLGTTNAYLTGAAALARALTAPAQAPPPREPGSGLPARGFPGWLAAAIAIAGAALAALTATGLASAGAVVMIPTTFLLAVYLGCTASAVRVLRGGVRVAAGLAVLAVAAVLAFSGWALLPAAAVTAAATAGPGRRPGRAAAVCRGRA
jgi:amino acid efflux transporter